MKTPALSVLLTTALPVALSAAIPQRWTVETSRVQPAQFEAFHGETIDFAATMQSYGKPLAITNDLIGIYWQTNGMGSAYWTAPAEIRYEPSNPPTLQPSNLVFFARWTPSMDVGANVYSCFIGAPGEIYRAAFQLRLRPSPGATPSELPLPVKTLDFAQVQVLNAPYYTRGETDARIDSATNAIRRVDGAARPLPKYLHALDFDDPYPEAAAAYYRSRGNGKVDGGCSAVRDGGFLYRNFDFPFDDRAEFVVRMSAGNGRLASIGVAQVGTNLTEQIVTSGEPSHWYKALPGATVDGINENGVVCEVNVCGGDPHEDGWHTTGDIHPLGAVRWVLDNGTSAGMAASNLASRIKFPEGWTQNFHYTIADSSETWYVEGGEAYKWLNPSQRYVLTNWRIADKYQPESLLTESGVERDQLLYIYGASITNVWFTNAYRRETIPSWVSDLREVLAYTNEIFNAWATHTKEYFRGQKINGHSWWQTVHTSVYDITNRTLRVAVQEIPDWYTFACPAVGTDEAKVREIVQPMIEDATNGLLRVETDPTVGLTNGTIYVKGETITPLTEHQSLQPATNYTDRATNTLGAAISARIDGKQDPIPDYTTTNAVYDIASTVAENGVPRIWSVNDARYTVQGGQMYQMVPAALGGYVTVYKKVGEGETQEIELRFKEMTDYYGIYTWTNGAYKVTYTRSNDTIDISYAGLLKTVPQPNKVDPTIPGQDIGLTRDNSQYTFGSTVYYAVSHPQTDELRPEMYDRLMRVSEYRPAPEMTTNAVMDITSSAAVTNAGAVAEAEAYTDAGIVAHAVDETAHTDIRQSVSAKYTKPSSGIPKTDLASAVQTSLGKADSALQAAHNTSTTAHSDIRIAMVNYTDSVKAALEAEIADKADTTNVYAKAVVDAALAGKLDTSGGTITGEVCFYTLANLAGGAQFDSDTWVNGNFSVSSGYTADFDNMILNTDTFQANVDGGTHNYFLPPNDGTLALTSDIPDVDGKISTHDSSASAHTDIRQSVSAKYTKPSSGIPKTDLASAVQTSLGKADSALQAAHNTSTTAHADIRTAAANAQAHSEATRQIVSTWEGFLDGSNVVFSITNFISGAYSLDHAKLQIKELLPDSNEYRIVYDSRTEITNHTAAAKRELYGVVNSTAAVLRAEIAAKGDKAWGRRSSTGQEVPISNTVWVTEQNLRIAGGMEYERVAVGEGAIYVLCSKGQTPYMTGDEGALMLKDDGGTNYFGMVRSDSYTIGCNTDGIRRENHLVYLDYAVTMSDHPCIWYTESLEGDVEWEQLNLPDGSAVPGASHQVVWDESPRLGAQECYINCPEAKGFFRATIEVAGDARFRTNMPAEIPSFYCADDPTKKVKIIWNNGNPKFVEAQ